VIHFDGSMPGVWDVVGAFIRGEAVEEFADAFPSVFDGLLIGFFGGRF
jgi:hypothetical protein